jgi:hypothetical protein
MIIDGSEHQVSIPDDCIPIENGWYARLSGQGEVVLFDEDGMHIECMSMTREIFEEERAAYSLGRR